MAISKSSFTVVTLLIGLAMTLSGCGDSDERQKIQSEITVLQSEMGQLRATLNELKQQQAELRKANDINAAALHTQHDQLATLSHRTTTNEPVASGTSTAKTFGALLSDFKQKLTEAVSESQRRKVEAHVAAPQPQPSQVKLEALQRWASRNLLLASREDQLRAAMAQKFSREQGNRPFSADQFRFFDDQTKSAIILYTPELLPPELLTQ